MAEADEKESKTVMGKSSASFALYSNVKSANVQSLASWIYAGEMITRAV